jgi:hypothetical protein
MPQAIIYNTETLMTSTIEFDTQPKWLTDEIKAMMILRDNYHKNGDFDVYRFLRYKVNSGIKKS